MIKLNPKHQRIDTFFVLLLFVLFTITAFTLILVGIKQYQVTANTMTNNYEVRTASSYLIEKIHQNDSSHGVSVTKIEGTDALALSTEIDGRIYTTYIYYFDGYMREILVCSDSVFTLESGQAIIEIAGLELTSIDIDTVEAVVTNNKGKSCTVFLTTKSTD